MALLEPVRNIWGLIGKASEEAGSLLGIADSRGLTGVMRNLLGVDPEGLKKQVDGILGRGVMHLMLAGDRAGVETIMDFRKYATGFLVEFEELGDLIIKLNSDELVEQQEAVADMKAFINQKGPAYSHDRRDRAKEAEVQRLRKALGDIAALAEAEGTEAAPGAG